MKVAIAADCHDSWENLEKVIEVANGRGCGVLVFAGDLISPQGFPILKKFKGKVKFVWGNNEGERVELLRMMDACDEMELCGDVFEGELGGLRFFVNHYPRLAELAARSGEFDVCVHGHTHKFGEEKVGDCVLLNPGEVQGYKTGSGVFVIFDTESKSVERVKV